MRASWRALADAGLPSLADHAGETNRPHVTLLAASDLGGSADDAVRALAATAPLPTLRLGGLVVFGVPPRGLVLARQVVVDQVLLDLHVRIHAAVDQATADADADAAPVEVVPHTRPGSWTPHVTVALRLTTEQLGAAVEALGRIDPLDAQAAGLRRWDPRDRTTTEIA
ncbi:2'-5' RNA ligase family protein [Clavibacter nebraskensis]|uniref:2'-5' RNA ligase family protein n=1 Tax=Clavibacter nebraskensis TaxID=31963 RepID=A0ABY4MT30_9MICO|nr:2'-5' RNA ligase family protein [Clavibacter nebraskensis]UQB06400.1 2'-5' RNA ligase family protein [Clavibacter nebraskensis]UQB09224.1 2'-5' RNA ligase family protein [Clavibacter nebraskensis]UQB12059.1 2'-5' RNA ligase family protein [Clavibacter nebraskensis]UQB14902.1 2'-5' RNA ligase family protein [Clavibacter nebraskensis]UQB17736.1 2'-5' RNA ligase family protein [Clavibacter nebraskensis]